MRDLAILVPSRGRPESVARLVQACEKTCGTDYHLVFAFDDNDKLIQASKRAAGHSYVMTGPRKGLAEWTNVLWRELRHEFSYFASIGDDHIPRTPGWDTYLTGALDSHAGGFALVRDGPPAAATRPHRGRARAGRDELPGDVRHLRTGAERAWVDRRAVHGPLLHRCCVARSRGDGGLPLLPARGGAIPRSLD